MRVFLSRPDIIDEDIQAVTDVLKSPNLSLGPKMREFEEAMAAYAGRKYGISVNSGTSGLFLCMQALGIGPGDEVITTPFTFVASVNCILMTGATPVFVDIDPVSMNMDPDKLEAAITDKTKAIEPVIVFGDPTGIDRVCEIARKHNIPTVEDSCEGLGTVYKNTKVGAFCDMSVFAFYPNKQITTGEGGMILTDNKDLADMCYSLRNQGRGQGAGWLAHARLGYNYRLCDINSALGVSQLKRIELFKEKRKQVVSYYHELLNNEDRIIVPTEPDQCDMSWFVFVIRLKEQYTPDQRNQLLTMMHERGIQVSNYFPPAHLQPYMVEKFGYKKGDFPVTDQVCERTMALPFHNNLTKKEALIVAEELISCLDELDANTKV